MAELHSPNKKSKAPIQEQVGNESGMLGNNQQENVELFGMTCAFYRKYFLGAALQDLESDQEGDIDESLKNKYEYSLKFVRC